MKKTSITVNNSVHLVKTLLNNQFLCEFVDTNSKENIIFCSEISEDLYNICNIKTRNGEFIGKIITESNLNYLVADVVLESGKCYRNVKFRVEACGDKDLPYSIINLQLLESPTPVTILKPKDHQLIEETYETKADIIQDVKKIEKELQKVATKRQRERIKLRETNEQLASSLSKYKNELVNEYHNIKSLYEQKNQELNKSISQVSLEHKKALLESTQELLSRVEERLVEVVQERKEIDKSLELVKEYTDKQVAQGTKSAKEFARRILDLGGGGGSVAIQYAKGGTMNGNLNVVGKYLSGGVDLSNIFITSETDSQNLIFDNSLNLSITRGNTVNLSAVNTTFAAESGKYSSVYQSVCALSGSWVRSTSTLETPTSGLSAVSNIIACTQETYDTLTIKRPGTFYIII